MVPNGVSQQMAVESQIASAKILAAAVNYAVECFAQLYFGTLLGGKGNGRTRVHSFA